MNEVIRNLYGLVERDKPVLIHLLDNAISPSLMKAMTEHPTGVPWYGFARITRYLTDPDFCLGLKRSGCVMLKLGLESGDQSVLDHLHKGIDLEEASVALRNLKKAGIATYVYLLFGTPAESQANAVKSDYGLENLGMSNFRKVYWNLPTEALYEEIPSHDIFFYMSHCHYTYHHIPHDSLLEMFVSALAFPKTKLHPKLRVVLVLVHHTSLVWAFSFSFIIKWERGAFFQVYLCSPLSLPRHYLISNNEFL